MELFILQKVLYTGKCPLDYLNVLHIKKKIKNGLLKGSLGNQKRFFYGIAVKTALWKLYFEVF